MITHLLTSEDLDALESAMLDKADAAIGHPGNPCEIWQAAVQLIQQHRSASYQRRLKLAPSDTQRRKSLGLRLTR
jgi:hypothetical protein